VGFEPGSLVSEADAVPITPRRQPQQRVSIFFHFANGKVTKECSTRSLHMVHTYDHKFSAVKFGFFLNTSVMIQNFAKTNSILNTKFFFFLKNQCRDLFFCKSNSILNKNAIFWPNLKVSAPECRNTQFGSFSNWLFGFSFVFTNC
jgi:hypothetical protein